MSDTLKIALLYACLAVLWVVLMAGSAWLWIKFIQWAAGSC